MTIAINMIVLPGQPALPIWVLHLLHHWAIKQPATKFLWICQNFPSSIAKPSPNIEIIYSSINNKFKIGWKWWYQYQLPKILKKHNAQAVVQANGLCSKRCKLPQYCILPDFLLEYSKEITPNTKAYFYQQLPYTIKTAKHIFVLSQAAKFFFEKDTAITEKNIDILYPHHLPNYLPSDWNKQETTQNRIANGNAYWLYRGSSKSHQLITLLKAFTQFKKWHKSGMYMVMALTNLPDEETQKNLSTYKLRDQVAVLPLLPDEELSDIVASAYGCFFTDETDPPLHDMGHAITCRIPVVSVENAISGYWLKDGVILLKNAGTDELFHYMNQLFKDEDLRNSIIKKGEELANAHQPVDSLKLLQKITQ